MNTKYQWRGGNNRSDGLTKRQIQVLGLIGDGLQTKEIADKLKVSPKTIENHRHRLYKDLGTTNMAKLIKIAVGFGLTALCIMGLTAAPAQSVPIKLVWNNPLITDAGASNLTYRLYSTTNLSLPTNQWTVTLIGAGFTNTPMTLCTTQSFVYDNWFFYMTWTNQMWRRESPFSNQAVPDRLPSNFLQFNFNVQATP